MDGDNMSLDLMTDKHQKTLYSTRIVHSKTTVL